MKLQIKIEKTDEAKRLEKEFGLNFDLIQAFPYDAGFDLRACIPGTVYINPHRTMIIPSGLKMQMLSPNYEIQIRSRSGLAAKHGIQVLNSPGTIDFGYRLEIMLILHNTSGEEFKIVPGDRVAQACFREIPSVEMSYVDRIDEKIELIEKIEAGMQAKGVVKLPEAKRGGLGSTGVK